ncbi:MAG: sugar phosphate isomerase/epimerase [Clostridia bacterium]|nr:sugar phosphate isomerase/epimerase [Clostridia bacterium]
MGRKLGIESHCLPGVAQDEALELIKATGFEAFFTGYNSTEEVCALRKKGDELGLTYDFIHAPFRGINSLWTPALDYLPLYDKIIDSIDAAAEAGVPTVVVHVTSGWWPPHLSDIGFARFDGLVEHAIHRGVKIAFENIRKVGNLAAIMDRYERVENVGFCFDNGHEHCYTETVKFLDLYPKRTLCTHIHDNHGRDKNDPWLDADYHLVPFDGSYDFKDMMDRMNKYGYEGNLTMEITKKAPYADMANEDWLKMVYERLVKISNM